MKFKVIDKDTGKGLKLRALQYDIYEENRLISVMADFEGNTRLYVDPKEKTPPLPDNMEKFDLSKVEVTVEEK